MVHLQFRRTGGDAGFLYFETLLSHCNLEFCLMVALGHVKCIYAKLQPSFKMYCSHDFCMNHCEPILLRLEKHMPPHKSDFLGT